MTTPTPKSDLKQRLIFTTLASAIISAALYLFVLHQAYSYENNGVPAQTEMSPRLKNLFARTKAVCFGRYVLEVPQEAQLISGYQEMPAKIITHENAASKERDVVEAFRKETLTEDPEAEFTPIIAGPVQNSLVQRYFASPYLKSVGGEGIISFVPAGSHVFEFGWGSGDEESADQIIVKSADIARKLRARDNAEVPKGPGSALTWASLQKLPDNSKRYSPPEFIFQACLM